MADTIASVRLSGTEYESVLDLVGIADGVAVSVQNISRYPVEIAISASQPLTTFTGEIIPANPSDKLFVSTGENRVWLKGRGPVSIQEV